MAKTYPLDATDAELAQKSAELSARVLEYDRKTGNAEDLIKDSVLFNVTYIERQNRASAKAIRQMVWLAWVSSFVALGSLVVAWLAYQSAGASDEWQAKQLSILSSIASNTLRPQAAAVIPSGQAKPSVTPHQRPRGDG